MPALAVVGAQWGDEGKGRIVDFLAEQAEVVMRFQGGNNAGHTLVVGSQTFRLHLVPSGILYPGVLCLIGNGVVVDPRLLLEEIDGLKARGIDTSGLRVSDRAHVVFPYHVVLDPLEEEQRGRHRVGTTGRGVGPAYVDKTNRIGIRMVDLVHPELLAQRLRETLPHKNRLLREVYGHEGFAEEALFGEYAAYGERLRPLTVDTSLLLDEALRAGRRVLFEGAQGTLLDLDLGTYPYVTASHPGAGGISAGSGVGPNRVERVLGVAKAYTTRVGMGPFPTEMEPSLAHTVRERGHEYGTTTGRPRRCGWFDGVVARYAVRVNGLAGLAVTKLDVLAGLPEIRIATAYRYRGELLRDFPAHPEVLAGCKPVYETLPGWSQDVSRARRLAELPGAARAYLDRIAEVAGAEVELASVGPGREELIVVREPF